MEETPPKSMLPCWLPFSCGAMLAEQDSKPEAIRWWSQHTDDVSGGEGHLPDIKDRVDRNIVFMKRGQVMPTMHAQDQLRAAIAGRKPDAVWETLARDGMERVEESLLVRACRRGVALEIDWLPTRVMTAEILDGLSIAINGATSFPGMTGANALPASHRQCAICRMSYRVGDRQALLPCFHRFHEDCVKECLAHGHECPVCKAIVTETHVNYGAPAFQTRHVDGAGVDLGQPANVLLVENLPSKVNQQYLSLLFGQYFGFQGARLIKGHRIAYIEFANVMQAQAAERSLQGYLVTPHMPLKISSGRELELRSRCAT